MLSVLTHYQQILYLRLTKQKRNIMTKDEQVQLIITKYDLLFESRLSKIETTLEKAEKNLDGTFRSLNDTIKEIKNDIRWMFGIMLSFYGIMLGLMAKGFHWFT